jgi:hypothetical protein
MHMLIGPSRESRLEASASSSSSDTIQNDQELSSPAVSEESCKTRDDLSLPSVCILGGQASWEIKCEEQLRMY